jgi:hypothetical protein
MKANITLKFDADLLREARVLAAEEGRSVSGLLTERLEDMFASGRRSIRPVGGRWLDFGKDSTSIGHLPGRETNSMSDKHFVDTNILMYAHDLAAGPKMSAQRH